MLQIIKKPTLSSKHMTSFTATKLPCLLLGKSLFSNTLPLSSQLCQRRFSTALNIPLSSEHESMQIPSFSFPWMWLDDTVSLAPGSQNEKPAKEKLPDVADEGFISKREFNPQLDLETYEKPPSASEAFFAPEGMSFEDFQGLL